MGAPDVQRHLPRLHDTHHQAPLAGCLHRVAPLLCYVPAAPPPQRAPALPQRVEHAGSGGEGVAAVVLQQLRAPRRSDLVDAVEAAAADVGREPTAQAALQLCVRLPLLHRSPHGAGTSFRGELGSQPPHRRRLPRVRVPPAQCTADAEVVDGGGGDDLKGRQLARCTVPVAERQPQMASTHHVHHTAHRRRVELVDAHRAAQPPPRPGQTHASRCSQLSGAQLVARLPLRPLAQRVAQAHGVDSRLRVCRHGPQLDGVRPATTPHDEAPAQEVVPRMVGRTAVHGTAVDAFGNATAPRPPCDSAHTAVVVVLQAGRNGVHAASTAGERPPRGDASLQA